MRTFAPEHSTAMANAIDRIFGAQAMFVEGLLFHCAGTSSSEYRGGSWAFATNDDGTLGYWYPLDRDTYPVACQNYYDNSAMDAQSFGAACTLIAVNQHAWRMHEAGEQAIAKSASAMYHALYDWIFTLADQPDSPFDGGAIAGFID
jgi:hypothetical protein